MKILQCEERNLIYPNFKNRHLEWKKIFGVYIFPLIIVWGVCICFIKYNTSLRIVGDEFGYWASGAWMAGLDWSEVASYNSYYGYGYGLFLMLILKTPWSMSVKYQIAICVNILFLSLTYIIIYKLIQQIADLNIFLKVSLSLLVVLYTGNIFYTQFTMPETLILFLYWSLIYLIFNLLKTYKMRNIILASFILAYMFCVHQRTVGVVLSSVLVLVYILLKNKKYKDIIIFSGCLIGLFLVGGLIKEIYQSTFLFNAYDSILSVNNISGQTDKIKMIFSAEGFWKLIVSLAGKILYVISSGALFPLLGLIIIGKSVMSAIKNKMFSSYTVFYSYLGLCTITTLGIEAVFLVKTANRFDTWIYGRYAEAIVGPLILLGLLYFFDKTIKKNVFVHLGMISFSVVLAVFIHHLIPYDAEINNSFFSCPGVYDVLKICNNNVIKIVCKAIGIYTLFIILFWGLGKCKKTILLMFPIILIGLNWVGTYGFVYQKGTLSWSIEGCTREEALAAYIKNAGIDEELYYWGAQDRLAIDYLQFLLGDITSIHYVYDSEQLQRISGKFYLLTPTSTNIEDGLIQVENGPLFSSSYLNLWEVR